MIFTCSYIPVEDNALQLNSYLKINETIIFSTPQVSRYPEEHHCTDWYNSLSAESELSWGFCFQLNILLNCKHTGKYYTVCTKIWTVSNFKASQQTLLKLHTLMLPHKHLKSELHRDKSTEPLTPVVLRNPAEQVKLHTVLLLLLHIPSKFSAWATSRIEKSSWASCSTVHADPTYTVRGLKNTKGKTERSVRSLRNTQKVKQNPFFQNTSPHPFFFLSSEHWQSALFQIYFVRSLRLKYSCIHWYLRPPTTAYCQ